MRAEELMVGDYVRVANDVCIKKGAIVQVRRVDADAATRLPERELKGAVICFDIADEDRFTGGVWCKYLEPIPLSNEILEKIGFTCCSNYASILVRDDSMNVLWQAKYVPFTSMIEVKNKNTGEKVKVLCYSVHELQHALKICGIQKEITL